MDILRLNYSTSMGFASKLRANIFRAFVIVLFLVFSGRLAFLQIIEGQEHRRASQSQAFKEELIDPFRGHIYGRDGEILVDNDPSFTVRITPSDFKRESIPLLASILEIDSTEIIKILRKNRKYSRFHPIKVFKDIDYQKVSLIEEYNDLLKGVDVTIETKRKYHFSARMTHLIGYIRSASSRVLKNRPYYKPGDVIGQTGLEKSYEDMLRGKKGTKFIAINRSGKKVESFRGGESDTLPKNGYDLYITIDTKLQKKAERLLRYRRGSIVAIDPNNGEILCMVSKPDYNIRDFRSNISYELWNKLTNNRYKPLINRSVSTSYPPGSTWKMFMGLAALQEGIITKNSTIACTGSFQYRGKGKVYKDHGNYGNIPLRKALKVSSNVFFWKLGPELGIDKMHYYGEAFGFGKRLQIDIPSENSGLLPSAEWIKKNRGVGVSLDGSMVNIAIGQGDVLVTPVQLASYVATIANKGTVHQPHVVRAVYDSETDKIMPVALYHHRVPIDKKHFDVIHQGMYDVVNSSGGTAYNAKVPRLAVCGKTGTAQNTAGRDHSLFVCFAPMKNPKIAIAVIVENAGYGGEVAAPIAKDLMQYFFYPDRSNIRIRKTKTENNSQSGGQKPQRKADGTPDANQ